MQEFDYARGTTAFTTESISIWRLLAELNQQALQLLPEKNIQFVKDIRYDGDLDIDLPRFTRMLSNFVKNSREAMPNGGILTLTTDLGQMKLFCEFPKPDVVSRPTSFPRTFEPFVTHGKPHGTGLGLAIAKSVVEAHKGKISISSVQGSGTTVEIRLPVPASGKPE